MNYNFKDLTGQKFERLFVLEIDGKTNDNHYKWKCRCDCGKVVSVSGASLRQGLTKSCGCYSADKTSEIFKIHGEKGTQLHNTWCAMKSRCNNTNDGFYKDYGGRGIRVCDEWNKSNGYILFRDWANTNGYVRGLTIDRIDVNGDYEPSNCKWSTWKEQANNKRNNHFITYNGKTQTMTEWADEYKIDFKVLSSRILYGWSTERALTEPIRVRSLLVLNGETKSLNEWAKQYNISPSTISHRITTRKWPIEKAITEPPKHKPYKRLA